MEMKRTGHTRGDWLLGVVVWTLLFPLSALGEVRGWHQDLASARAEAKNRGVPLLVVFVHEGCPVCAELDAIFTTARAQQALAPLAKARLEFDENRAVALRYNVSVTPTLIVQCPDGKTVYRFEGLLSAAGLASMARRATARCASLEQSAAISGSSTNRTQRDGSARSSNPAMQPGTPGPNLSLLRTGIELFPASKHPRRDSYSASARYTRYHALGERADSLSTTK